EEIAQDMVDYVYKHWEKSAHSNDLSHIREIEQDVRDFLQALLSNMREFHPSEVVFWEGLAKLENSYSFLKYASLLFRYMWIRSEEHTSELQSRENLVCRLLLEKKKDNKFQF